MKKSASKGAVWNYSTGVSGMIRHTKSGKYYSRFQLIGKRTMTALETDVFSVAKERHLRRLADNASSREVIAEVVNGRGRMGDLLDLALAAYQADTALAEKSKAAFSSSIDRLLNHWPPCFGSSLRAARPEQINNAAVERFANYLHTQAEWRRFNTKAIRKGYGPVTVNKTLETLHRIMRFAKARGYVITVPFELRGELGQKDIRKAEPKKRHNFPSTEKISEVFTELRTVRDAPCDEPNLIKYLQARAHESADFAEFMAYSGARRGEATAWTWEDDAGDFVFLRGTKTESSRNRLVPKIPAMVDLLERMKTRRIAEDRKLSGPAFLIKECRDALTAACKRANVDRWTHHTLRHLFATRCIEAGVDIQTVSRWLGHADGGATAMQVYGHLRQEHSRQQAVKVDFPMMGKGVQVA